MDCLRAAVIDDDDEILDLIEQILKEEKVSTRRYSRAEDLLGDLSGRPGLDLVISDLVLPGMTGLDLLEDLDSRGIDTPVVLITGYASLDSAIEAVNKGAFYYIKKPFNIEEIRFVVTRLRQRRETLMTVRSLQSQVKSLQEKLQKEIRKNIASLPPPPPLEFPGADMDAAGRAFAAIEYLGRLKSDGLISSREFGEYKGKILKRIV